MLACVRQAAWRGQGSRGLLSEVVMSQLAPGSALARQAGLEGCTSGDLCVPSTSGRCGAAAAAGEAGWAQQQRRPFLNFVGLNGDVSKTYNERKLVGYSPRQMFDVVAAVENYHLFVPWCVKSTVVLRRPPSYMEAELEVGFQMFVERYTSKVTLASPVRVESRVDDSTLFHHLHNKWEFRPGPSPATCWLTFDVDFAFKSPLYRQIAGVFFEEVVQRMMGAFEGRCRQLYGPSSLHAKHQRAVGGR